MLHIENIAVIASADIVFEEGLNLLTGETGAGKSIILDALGAVIGRRASKDLVRTGAHCARVSAVFDKLPALVYDFLEENRFAGPEGDGGLFLSREVSADGRNICRINNRPATVALLRQLGALLLHIHGQHDSQALLDASTHLSALDRFAGTAARLSAYRQAYEKLKSCDRRRLALRMDEEEKARRILHLQYAADDIGAACLLPGEDQELLSRRRLLQNAERLTEALGEACACLAGDEQAEGARSLLSQAARAMADAAALHGDLTELHRRLCDLSFATEDVSASLEQLLDEFDASPGALDEVEERLDVIYRLKRKYGATIDEILRHREACQGELEALQQSERTLAALEAEYAQACEEATALAGELHGERAKAAATMAERVCGELRDLEMKQVRFEVEVNSRDGEGALRKDGSDDVRFLLAANAGEEPKPLSRIASGGELSRVMLALCNVLLDNNEAGAMVFDEIDAGVSGRAAGRVAEKLGRLSRGRQVLCVTHLPQIAAMADTHIRVEKGSAHGRTVTNVQTLDPPGRIEEISRLLGGLNVTDTVRRSASEQIKAADSYKKGLEIS